MYKASTAEALGGAPVQAGARNCLSEHLTAGYWFIDRRIPIQRRSVVAYSRMRTREYISTYVRGPSGYKQLRLIQSISQSINESILIMPRPLTRGHKAMMQITRLKCTGQCRRGLHYERKEKKTDVLVKHYRNTNRLRDSLTLLLQKIDDVHIGNRPTASKTYQVYLTQFDML